MAPLPPSGPVLGRPPDWGPAAWAAKLTIHMPGLIRGRLRQDKADHLVRLQRDMGDAAARRDQAT
eukprot:14349377-Alexandrium_andersonii.AAC.1